MHLFLQVCEMPGFLQQMLAHAQADSQKHAHAQLTRSLSPTRSRGGVVTSAAQLQAKLSSNHYLPDRMQSLATQAHRSPNQSPGSSVQGLRAPPHAYMPDQSAVAVGQPLSCFQLASECTKPKQQPHGNHQQHLRWSEIEYSTRADAHTSARPQPVHVVPLQAPAVRKTRLAGAGRIVYTESARHRMRRSMVTHGANTGSGNNTATGAMPRGRQRWWQQQPTVSDLAPDVTGVLPVQACKKDANRAQRRGKLPPLGNARMEAAQALALALRSPGALPIDPAIIARARRRGPFGRSIRVRSSPPSISESTEALDEFTNSSAAWDVEHQSGNWRPRTAFDPYSARSPHLQQYDACRQAARMSAAPSLRQVPQQRILVDGRQDGDVSARAASDRGSSAQQDAHSHVQAAPARRAAVHTESALMAGELCAWAQQPPAHHFDAVDSLQPSSSTLVARLSNFAPVLSRREIVMPADTQNEPSISHSSAASHVDDASELFAE